jgi:excisionase family DNA binding protein
MKRPPQDDEVQRLRDQLRLRIDTAAKSVAEVLQVAAGLLLAMARRNAESRAALDKVEARPASEMITSREAAAYLGVTPQTLDVWRCTRRYAIPFVKVGRKVCYRKADLDEFLHRRTENRGRSDESG